MADYKAMYLALFRASEEAVDLLIAAQRQVRGALSLLPRSGAADPGAAEGGGSMSGGGLCLSMKKAPLRGLRGHSQSTTRYIMTKWAMLPSRMNTWKIS